MDMEKMRKINELTAELKKHKFLDSEDPAHKRAEQMVMDKGAPALENDKPSVQLAKKSNVETVEVILAESNKKIREELNLFRKGLLQLNDELKNIKEDFSKQISDLKKKMLETPTVPPVKEESFVSEATKEKVSVKDVPVEESKSVPTKEEGERSRSGSFSSNDVAIDKVFYFGKK